MEVEMKKLEADMRKLETDMKKYVTEAFDGGWIIGFIFGATLAALYFYFV
jgi:hypothetical protein